MLRQPVVSIITTTYDRHKCLIQCIESVLGQKFNTSYEHIVVSDGLDSEVEAICRFYRLKYRCIEKDPDQGGSHGHLAKDTGIQIAEGRYICLWDDDNVYYDDALEALHRTAIGYDIGVCSAVYYKKHREDESEIFRSIPQSWNGKFVLGDIDTMNICVSRHFAIKACWKDSSLYEGDYIWLEKICRYNPSINFNNQVIGIKL